MVLSDLLKSVSGTETDGSQEYIEGNTTLASGFGISALWRLCFYSWQHEWDV